MLHKKINLLEHDYSKEDSWVGSEYLDEIVKYIAGSIVHFLKKRIHCEECLNILNGNVTTKSKLTMIKNRSGLNFASDDVNIVCRTTEKVLRKYKDKLLLKNINYIIG